MRVSRTIKKWFAILSIIILTTTLLIIFHNPSYPHEQFNNVEEYNYSGDLDLTNGKWRGLSDSEVRTYFEFVSQQNALFKAFLNLFYIFIRLATNIRQL